VGPSWIIEDRGGLGVDLYDRPDGNVVETLHVPGGPRVTPVGVRGNHWEIRTLAGRAAWLDSAEFPVPALSGTFVAEYQIHVATAFAFADEAYEPLLAIQIDTLAPRGALTSPAMTREVATIWSHYRPFTEGVARVSITVLSRDSDEAAPIRSSDGEVVGFRRLAHRLCSYRVDDSSWSPLGVCTSLRWLERPGNAGGPTPVEPPRTPWRKE
jgi:hypothetical protein